ncbi:hypothetical protein LIER_28340 [Lithospermum erythrorhizon]|uniref:Uncharacterized protein n=1 Tax=Lithospermum erythrorhizon TaxID=34254 RepID=A0AAV3RH00_LITER
MGHHTCCNKEKVKRGLWSPDEDEKLVNYINTYGQSCWSNVPKLAGLQRCGKSCRLRWINYLRPDLKRGSFSIYEANIIIQLHEILGNKWAQIARHLPGRTDNEVKNFWNSSLKKKLLNQGRNNNNKNHITPTSSILPSNLLIQNPSNTSSHDNNDIFYSFTQNSNFCSISSPPEVTLQGFVVNPLDDGDHQMMNFNNANIFSEIPCSSFEPTWATTSCYLPQILPPDANDLYQDQEVLFNESPKDPFMLPNNVDSLYGADHQDLMTMDRPIIMPNICNEGIYGNAVQEEAVATARFSSNEASLSIFHFSDQMSYLESILSLFPPASSSSSSSTMEEHLSPVAKVSICNNNKL